MTDTPTPPQPGAVDQLDPGEALQTTAAGWRAASDQELAAREVRDRAIVAAREAGHGVRWIARVAGIDPTQVGRVLRREEER